MEASTQGFAARRPAAGNLPGFQLPPVSSQDTTPSMPRYPLPPASAVHSLPHPQDTSSSSSSAVPRVLTPSSGVASSEGLSPLSHIHGGSNQTPQSGSVNAAGYAYQSGNWPTPSASSNSSYVFSSSSNEQTTPISQPSYSSASSSRATMYSPNMGYNTQRSSQSPATANDNSSGPPPQSYGISSYSNSSTAGHAQSNAQQNPILSSQAPVSQPPPQSSAAPVSDSYSRPAPPQSYYTPSSTPQQSSFSAYSSHPPPSQPSPHPASSSTLSRGLVSSVPPHTSSIQAPPQPYHPRAHFYSNSVMGGTVLSNISSPNGPMTLVNGMGVGPPMYSMYGHHPPPAQNERPYKCDVCPQSFNRNHDLKRHKRIHLAVKPFPCNHCDKSFSRKDALKRHKLVKGCGSKDEPNAAANANEKSTNGASAPDRNEVLSDGTEESPRMSKIPPGRDIPQQK